MTTAKARHAFAVRLAAGIAGYCAFINLYSPQSILPLLSEEFGASAAGISTIITVSTLAVALTAPFTGTVADVLGRKRVIVVAMFALVIPTIMVGLSTSLPAMIFWRAVQGLVLPPIFAVMVAYIGDELPHHEATTVAGIYSSGSSLGGFSGRLFVGLLADLVSWRAGFMALAAIAFVGAIIVAFLLPHERKFVRSEGLLSSGKQMLAHLRNRQLIATYAVGFGVLFNFITTFTYVSFYLAAPPFNLSASWLGALFVVYLAGVAAYTVDRLGCRKVRATTIHGARYCDLGCIGIALTLAPSLPLIIAGLAISAACGLICQAISTAYVTVTAKAGRSSAVGLYVTSFYVGGSFGAALGGLAWNFGGWPACVALVAAMLAIMSAIVIFAWARRVPASTEVPPIEPP